MNKLTIVATWPHTGNQMEIEVTNFEVRGRTLIARIIGSDKVTELDLIDPRAGWQVFTD